MKTTLLFTSVFLLILCLLPISGSCEAEYTILEDFSTDLNGIMSHSIDLSAYGLNCAEAEIKDQQLVITPNYPSVYMSYFYSLSKNTAKTALATNSELRFFIQNNTNSDCTVSIELFFASALPGYNHPFVLSDAARLISNDIAQKPIYVDVGVVIPAGFSGYLAIPCSIATAHGEKAGFVKNRYATNLTDYSDAAFENINSVRLDLRTVNATSGTIVLDDFSVYSSAFISASPTPSPSLPVSQPKKTDSFEWYYIVPFLVVAVVGGIVLFLRRIKK